MRWTFIGLAKLDSPAALFERKEICPDCTTKVRRLLQDQQAAPQWQVSHLRHHDPGDDREQEQGVARVARQGIQAAQHRASASRQASRCAAPLAGAAARPSLAVAALAAGAAAVKYYDNANCTQYGTCDYEKKLADAVLKYSYTCSPSLRIRAQDMTVPQLQESCAILAKEETFFHDMLQTNRKPVANDLNSTLELVVFDDYANYSKYASVIYDISTDNGGMYLEGDPSVAGNQARFIAHEASWLRPTFSVWNLQHEYVHYQIGRAHV